MKKIILLLTILFPLSLFANTYDDMAAELLNKIPAKDKKKTLAVMPFSSDKRFADDAKVATEELTKALITAGATVSERSQIDKLIKEQELQQTGIVSNEDAGELAQGLGAKYVILGSVSKLNKYGEEGNIGIKISARLVSSSSYKVLAVATGEAAAGDASAKYKRKAPRKAAQYPQFLDAFGGATFYQYRSSNHKNLTDDDRITGLSGGLRFTHSGKGFFTSSWEFLASTRKFGSENDDARINVYSFSWIPTIRIPLWAYSDSLPDYTSIYLGYSFGIGISQLKYSGKDDTDGYAGVSSAILGLRIGLSDSVSIFTEMKYSPHRFNQLLGLEGAYGDLTGPAAYFGISLAP